MVGSLYGLLFLMGSFDDEEWLFWRNGEELKVCNVQKRLLAADDETGWG